MIRTKSQKYCEAVDLYWGLSWLPFYIHSSFMQLVPAGYLTSSLSPHPIKTYSNENSPLWHIYSPGCGSQSPVSQILNCHPSAPMLSLPATPALDILLYAIPRVLPTHYTLSMYLLSIYSQYLKCLYFLEGLANDHLSFDLSSSVITCSRKTLLKT